MHDDDSLTETQAARPWQEVNTHAAPWAEVPAARPWAEAPAARPWAKRAHQSQQPGHGGKRQYNGRFQNNNNNIQAKSRDTRTTNADVTSGSGVSGAKQPLVCPMCKEEFSVQRVLKQHIAEHVKLLKDPCNAWPTC